MSEDVRKPSQEEKRQKNLQRAFTPCRRSSRWRRRVRTVDKVRREFETHRFGAIYEDDEMVEGDTDLFRQILEEAVNWQARIDQMTDRALVAKWPIDRIDPVLRALFRAAGAELTLPATPPRVVITEYVDVAHAFSRTDASRSSSMRCLIIWPAKHGPKHSDPSAAGRDKPALMRHTATKEKRGGAP